MSSHEGWSQGASLGREKRLVADAFDVDVTHLESLSWSLGSRVTVESDAPRSFALEHRRSTRTLTVFAVTDNTRVVRLRTPIGREKFYGVAAADVSAAPPSSDWVRTD